MKFGDFANVPLADFLADRSADDFWFFVHIPKTAGSSLAAELSQVVAPYRNLSVDYAKMRGSFDSEIGKVVHDYLAGEDFARDRSGSGHLSMDLARLLGQANDRVRYFTFLRHPVARVISDYRYQRTPMHPPYEKFIKDFPTLESYVDLPASQNKMSYFVTGNRDATKAEVLRCADTEFDFIGLLEMYPMSFNILFNLLGKPGRFPVEHVRKTPDTAQTSVTITPAAEAAIRDRNALDMALYNHVHARLLARRDEWRASASARRPAAKPQRADAQASA